ncbi:uncharacterized protein LOC143912666 [Arctopsyche grandis]|uniref:uncharacterized protein LOC143912666 n=1 Tax=Arctopsyche grandis TaxID=121162 RepID=UPI00406D9E35
MHVQTMNPNYEVGMHGGSTIVVTDSGYMKAETFTFLDRFIGHKPPGTTILILGEFRSHCSDPDSLEKALDHDVHLLCLPPHSTSKLQPLDVGLFAILKKKNITMRAVARI